VTALPKSKTDQEGQGREVEIARGSQPEHTPLSECTCPVRALVLIPLMWALDSGDVGRASERSDAGWFLQ